MQTISGLTIAPPRLPLVSRAFFERTNPVDSARRRQLFVEIKLAIAKSPEFESEFGMYPVLYVNLSVSQYLDCAASHTDRGKMMVRT